ncbi:hypothetical protein PILCRDRAFT_13113 [Piloderma croceum F 1598]|uniref:Protein kinase domain-containing protein n=1 Tax=Piloderma croceum (strain F 1598) TaxID=765440 RepID=A0A0C3F7K3_PILCF|nr:hypothetical protein PILCRDRAFT_13113 [Piloderma croceum F 1598]
MSRWYGPEDKAPLEPPIRGGDKTVSEFMGDIHIPRNPFQTDIYYAGNLIISGVMKVNKDISPLAAVFHVCPPREYKGFDFMRPLLLAMVHKDPAKRPTIDQVINRFTEMCKELGTFKLRARVGPRDERTPANPYECLIPVPPNFGGLEPKCPMQITEFRASGADIYGTMLHRIWGFLNHV